MSWRKHFETVWTLYKQSVVMKIMIVPVYRIAMI